MAPVETAGMGALHHLHALIPTPMIGIEWTWYSGMQVSFIGKIRRPQRSGSCQQPEGCVRAIIDFRKDSPEGPPPEFRFEADQIIAEMKQAGYRLDAKNDFLPRQHVLVFRR